MKNSLKKPSISTYFEKFRIRNTIWFFETAHVCGKQKKHIMLHFTVLVILSVVNVSLISSKKTDMAMILSPSEAVKEYSKTKFDLFHNPMTVFWRLGLEPTCMHFKRTIRTICIKIYRRIKEKLDLIKLDEKSNNFDYGCYKFRIKDEKGADQMQRVNRCPFALKEKEQGESNIFISHCFTKSNSYFLYAAKEVTKKAMRVKNADVKDAKIIALVTADEKATWVLEKPPDF